MRVVITRRAERALAEIGDWIARDDRVRARSFIAEITDICMALADFPRAYPRVETRSGAALHCRTYGNYLIFYLIEPESVSIVTVVHAARDPKRWFEEL